MSNKKEKQKLVGMIKKMPQKIDLTVENEENVFYYWGGVAKFLEHYFKGKKPPTDYPQWHQDILELSVKRYLAFYDACFFGWAAIESALVMLPFDDSPLSALKWLIFSEAEKHGATPMEQRWKDLQTYAPLHYLHKHGHLPAKEKKKANAALNRIKGDWRERDRDNQQILYDCLQLLACDNSAQDAVKRFLELDDKMMETAIYYSEQSAKLNATLSRGNEKSAKTYNR